MWKLLSEEDSANETKLGTPLVNGNGDPEDSVQSIQTIGLDGYVCQNCQNFTTKCEAAGISISAMPCTWSPRRPERYFKAIACPAATAALATVPAMRVGDLAVLFTEVKRALDEKIAIKIARSKYPYAPGDTVQVIHNGVLVPAKVESVSESDVSVVILVADSPKACLLHGSVIPPRSV